MDGEKIKWIVADEGWSKNDKKMFQKAIDILLKAYEELCLEKPNISLKFIDHKNELVSYINKSGRNNDPVKKFFVFSHGFSDGTISLGYNYSTYNTNLDFTKDDIENLNTSSFSNTKSVFYSCNTGTGNQSFAQEWVNKTGGKAKAFIGKSDYANINKNANWYIKWNRFLYGFSTVGSSNYPVAGNNAKVHTFYPKE